jgi:hypothetical protein
MQLEERRGQGERKNTKIEGRREKMQHEGDKDRMEAKQTEHT